MSAFAITMGGFALGFLVGIACMLGLWLMVIAAEVRANTSKGEK